MSSDRGFLVQYRKVKEERILKEDEKKREKEQVGRNLAAIENKKNFEIEELKKQLETARKSK